VIASTAAFSNNLTMMTSMITLDMRYSLIDVWRAV
jgi:hypothetical protein